MILLIVIVAVMLVILLSEKNAVHFSFKLIAGLLVFSTVIICFNEHWERTANSFEEEKFNLFSEYSFYLDKSEISKKIEEHNKNCDKNESKANNVWLNPIALFNEYDFDELKINIENLKD